MNKRLNLAVTLLLGLALLLALLNFLHRPVLAASSKELESFDRSSYYDFGPYYGPKQQVLGISLSSLEELPPPPIPDSAVIPQGSGVLPDSFFYPFELFTENVQLTFTLDSIRREELRLQLASERLSEAKALLDQRKEAAAVSALASYKDTFRTITENLGKLSAEGTPGVENLAAKVETEATDHAVAARSLAISSPPAVSQDWASVVDVSVQAIDQAADATKQPPIPEDLSASIQELKNQGLITPEESSKLYGFESRSAVREELDRLASNGQFPTSEVLRLDSAIATRYPDTYDQTLNTFQFSELKSYQTLPVPSAEISAKIQSWRQQADKVSPPEEIKPYLYYQRAESLAKKIDLTDFTDNQTAQVVQTYSQALSQNPTFTPPPAGGPSPSPSPTPPSTPTSEAGQAQTEATPSAVVSPTLSPTPILASAEPYILGYQGPLPGTPGYLFKQFTETLRSTTTFDPNKRLELQMEFAEERLKEINALAKEGQLGSSYNAALERYKNQVETITENLESFRGPEQTRNDLAERLEVEVARHNIAFEKGLIPPSKDNPKLYTEVIQATENALDQSADTLERPPLPQQLATRLQDLKSQGLILSEEVDQLTKAGNREEVRDQIRKLVEIGSFPLADAKKLDEIQGYSFPQDYNQLVEVRKVEELQRLRSAQAEFAQTPALRSTKDSYDQRLQNLLATIDPAFIKPEDLGGRQDLIETYEEILSVPRPINGGQFGVEATPGAQLSTTTLSRQDAVISACPEGAVFKQFEGCVWADSGKSLNDYDQYKCEGPRQYYSFAARKCVAYNPAKGWKSDDAKPLCPVGYTWSWPTQSCQAYTGGGPIPLPTPLPEPEPKDEKELEERSKSCPEGSSYQPPNGCTWDKSGKSISDTNQYRCSKGQYYSFGQGECVALPKEGQPYPKDIKPVCKEEELFFDWFTRQCIFPQPIPLAQGQPGATIIDEFRPPFITPYSPFYFLKQAGEGLQRNLAFSTEARGQVSLSQAEERLSEAAEALKRNDEQGFKQALEAYTYTMQSIVADVSKESFTESAKAKIGQQLSQGSVEQNILLQKLSAWASQDQETIINAAVSASVLGIDKAADIGGEPPIPSDLKDKIEALPEKMITEEDKKALLGIESRVEARLKLSGLLATGGLTQTDIAYLNEDFESIDQNSRIKVEELKKLEEIATATENKDQLTEKIETNEDIVQKLQKFEEEFEPGQEVPSEIRPYIRLTRIGEVTQTIRPDIVRLEDFQNRKDLLLAVATLQQEFKPTKESYRQVEDFRRRNPGTTLPPDLARIEALSWSLGVRGEAGPCFLPTPPFPANTPCPAPGAAIPITSSYYIELADDRGYRPGYTTPGVSISPSTDKDGNPLVYGQGPKAQSAGVCPEGYHWMYDSGGWCMSNSGNYSSSYTYTPTGTGPGYTPYSPYYTAPGAPPPTYNYQDNNTSDGCRYGYDKDSSGGCVVSEGYRFVTTYSPPTYYGTAPTYYTTNPPSGTVPGSGPKPTAPGRCPSGYHWMSDSGGWCMSDGPTYVPSGGSYSSTYYPAGTSTSSTPPEGGYNCGSQPYDPVTKKCRDGACPGGFNWDGGKCVAGSYSSGGSTPWCWSAFPPPGGWSCESGFSWDGSSCSCKSTSGGGYSPNLNQSSCGPGYYWDGRGCVRTTPYDTYGSCQPPSSGCGTSAYWDYGSCSCRGSSPYYGGSCSPPSGGCGSGWFDSSSCSCKQASSQGCYNVSASSCGSGFYWDSAACTCRSSGSPSSTSSGGSTSGSCPSGYHWMSDNGGWCMSDSAASSSSSTSTSTSSGSCPSGSHWMSDNGGYCMSDSGSSSTSSSQSTSTPAPTSAPTTTTETSPPPPSGPAPTSAP